MFLIKKSQKFRDVIFQHLTAYETIYDMFYIHRGNLDVNMSHEHFIYFIFRNFSFVCVFGSLILLEMVDVYYRL